MVYGYQEFTVYFYSVMNLDSYAYFEILIRIPISQNLVGQDPDPGSVSPKGLDQDLKLDTY